MNSVIYNQEIFQTDSSIRNINTKNKRPLHRPIVNLSYFQKCTFYAGKKNSSFPPPVIILKKDRAKFKAAVRKYVHRHTFYFVDEFFMCEYDL